MKFYEKFQYKNNQSGINNLLCYLKDCPVHLYAFGLSDADLTQNNFSRDFTVADEF